MGCQRPFLDSSRVLIEALGTKDPKMQRVLIGTLGTKDPKMRRVLKDAGTKPHFKSKYRLPRIFMKYVFVPVLCQDR